MANGTCPRCGVGVDAERFCPSCGLNLSLADAEPRAATPPTAPGPDGPAGSTPDPRAASTPGTDRSAVAVWVALALLALGGGVVAAVLLLGSDDDEPRGGDTAPAQTVVDTRTVATATSVPRRRGPPPSRPARTISALGEWSSTLPSGWSVTSREHLNPGLHRTVLRREGRETVWIDTTPSEAPQFDTSTVRLLGDDVSTGYRTLRFTAGRPAFCAPGSCTLVQIFTASGGVAVLGGPTPEARAAAKSVARTMNTATGG